MSELQVYSYAKINIGLYVLDKLKDGYHEINTLFQQIELCDKLRFIRSKEGMEIFCDDPQVPAGEDNLIVKAFQYFKDKCSITGGLKVSLKKNIPMGAGLAGGSSNAAVTLLAVNKLWGNPLDRSELMDIAIHLGADVPFFITGVSCIGRGKGEILENIDYDRDWSVVLLCPELSISTKWVYNQTKFILTKIKKNVNLRAIFESFDYNTLQDNVYNELEGIVFKRYPFLKKIKDQLKEMGAFYVSMSGSGSSMYGMFTDKQHALEVKKFFTIERKMTAILTEPVKTFPYRSWLKNE